MKKSARAKTKRSTHAKRRNRGQRVAPVGHVIAMDFKKTGPNPFVKALGNWIGRANHALARRAG